MNNTHQLPQKELPSQAKSSKMELNMRENGTRLEKKMVVECKSGQMDRFMRGTGRMEWRMVKGVSSMQTEISKTEIGLQIRLTALASTCMLMDQNTKVNGFKTSSKVKGKKYGQMELSLKATI